MDGDRISRLPDELLLRILSFLPTKYAVSTSALSHRWSNLWTSLPIFNLETPILSKLNTLPFVNFVNNLIIVNTSPTISKFRLKTEKFHSRYLSRINWWIQSVLSRNVIQLDLDIKFDDEFDNDEVCLRLLPCDSLQILKLSTNFGLHMPISSCCFRNLRVFHLDFLESPMYQKLVPELFPNLPLLEELSILAWLWMTEDQEITFNIVAPALKFFSFAIDVLATEYVEAKIVIDAPLLEKICIHQGYISSYSFKTRLCFTEAKALVISPQNELPALPFLTKLKLVIPYAPIWKLLLPLLSNAPNLEVLILEVKEYKYISNRKEESLLADLIGKFQFIPPKYLPTCLLLHLKEIEVSGVKKIKEFKVLEYIVENAKVLKKLTLHPVSTQ